MILFIAVNVENKTGWYDFTRILNIYKEAVLVRVVLY